MIQLEIGTSVMAQVTKETCCMVTKTACSSEMISIFRFLSKKPHDGVVCLMNVSSKKRSENKIPVIGVRFSVILPKQKQVVKTISIPVKGLEVFVNDEPLCYTSLLPA